MSTLNAGRRSFTGHVRALRHMNPFIVILTGILAYIIPQIFLVVIFAILQAFGWYEHSGELSIVATFGLSVVIDAGMLSIIWLVLHNYREDVRSFFTRLRPTVGMLLRVAVAYVGYIAILLLAFSLVDRIFVSFNLDQEQENTFKEAASSIEMVLSFISLVILTPIAEELVFRGFVYRGLKGGLGIIWAALVTSLLFGLVHAQWNVAVDTFILSLWAIWLYEKTGSIIAPILLHALKNAVAFAIIYEIFT